MSFLLSIENLGKIGRQGLVLGMICLRRNPLNINQHAYQSGKFTDTALISVVSTIEKALKTQEIASGAFLDIEGTFFRTSIEAISSALLRHGVPPLFKMDCLHAEQQMYYI